MSETLTDTSLDFSVNVLPETFEKTNLDSIVGTIFVRANDHAFPEDTWSDFGVVIVEWWLNQMFSLLNGKKQVSCKFMDGSFRYDIETQTGGMWKLRLIEEKAKGDVCELEGIVEPNAAIKSLLIAAQKIIKICHERGWNTRDVESLEATYAKLDEQRTLVPLLV